MNPDWVRWIFWPGGSIWIPFLGIFVIMFFGWLLGKAGWDEDNDRD